MSSGFIHEHGLACELAGLHYRRLGEDHVALNFFQRAKDSYLQWGSGIKVESMMEKMNMIASSS